MIPSSFKPDTQSDTQGGLPSSFKSDVSTQSPQSSLSDSIWSSIAGNVGQAVQQGGDAVNSAFTDPTKNPLQQGFDSSVAAAGAVPNIVASAIPGGTKVAGAVGAAGSGVVNWLGNLIGGTKQAQDFVTKFPDAANALHQTASVGQGLGTISSTILGAEGGANLGDATVNAVQDTTGAVKGAGYVADTTKPQPTKAAVDLKDPSLNKIQDLISPKIDAKATKLALAEGRIAPGEEPGMLRDGTPDQILPSKDTVNAAATIKKQIPGAENMNQIELHGALDKKITQIATKLQPEMKQVPITDQVVNKVMDAWEKLKTTQAEDPYSPPDLKLEKLQANFQREYLDPIINKNAETSMNQSLGVSQAKIPNMDDLWENAKAYDKSVPANVRAATSQSSDVLQAQKSIWLQNRGVLRDALKDTKTGLGLKSETAFDTMHDMYNAQKGIQSSYKLSKEGAPSGVKTFLKSPAGKAVKVGAGIAGAGALFKGGEALIP